jgi:hypothetical protein
VTTSPRAVVKEFLMILQANVPVREISSGNSRVIIPFYGIIFKGVTSSVYVTGY